MAFSCTSKCSGTVTSAPSAAGGAGIGCFSPIWQHPTYKESPAAARPGAGNPKTRKKKLHKCFLFPLCSGRLLHACSAPCPGLVNRCNLGLRGVVSARGPLTHLQGCTQEGQGLGVRGGISQTVVRLLRLSELWFLIYEWAGGQGSCLF